MAETGIYSTDLPLVAALDEVTGNATIDGIRRSARQSMADHAEQIMADGPIADALAAEAAARTSADASLDERVNTLETGNLPARMTAAEAELADHEIRIDNTESLIATGAKTPVAVSTLSTVNIPIATGLINGANIGGFVVSTGQLVVLAGQTAPAENGAYPVVAAGATARASAFDTSAELLGATFGVTNGTVQGTVYAVRNTGAINVGVDAIVITHAYGTPGNPTQAEVTAARQGYVDVAANLTAMKASTSALALTADTLAQIEGLSIATAKLTEAAGSITPTCFRSYNFVSGTVVEQVVIARAGERSLLQLLSNNYTVNFDLAAGTFSGSGAWFTSASMTALGGGWYECKVVITPTSSGSLNVQTRFSAAGAYPYAGDSVSGMYVRSIVLRLPNTTANLFPSSDPTNAAFTKTSFTATSTVSPEVRSLPPLQAAVDAFDLQINGRLTADKIIEPSGSGSPTVYQARSWVIGDVVVIDVIAKKAERTRFNLFSNSGFIFDCTFDLVNGTCSGTGASILALGNGWYRCRVAGTATATGSANVQHRVFPAAGGHPYVGDGVSGLYLQQSSLSVNGGINVLASPSDYSSASWLKTAGTTVAANVGNYLGLLSDPSTFGAGAYDDGRIALVGKKWTALGTSITAQAQYTTPLASSSGMVLTNAGVSGAALGVSTTGYPSTGIYDAIATIPTDSEIVTLEAGVNDFWAQEVLLGALNDTTTSTFYGALWAAVVAIRARAPNAKIIFITPYSGGSGHATARIMRTNSHGNTLDQFQKAVRDVANLTGYPCIDIAGKSGIGYFTGLLYMSDNLHINATGGTRYANCALDDLRKLSRAGFFGT
ncbi:SGNH/GDSL hydrolase family protein [Mesorhizobium sp. M0663]|uniref:SGNH/GDSL hydrolase family protein n=1 Tax=Mesorhizobium sp. M0663 TaxID=2956981 RepID=UPI003338A1E3